MVNGEWVTGNPSEGERFRLYDAGGGCCEKTYKAPASQEVKKEKQERKWRDMELLRTDTLEILSDYPRYATKQSFLDYRRAVATWDTNPDFPNSKLRPLWEDKK